MASGILVCRAIRNSLSTMSDLPLNSENRPVVIATRGSALALAQTNMVMAECREAFPRLSFKIKIIKTTGDKLQTLSLTNPTEQVPKGLFTKELESALLNGDADMAVHSLKDLPTELPDGLTLGAVSKRADVRDVLIYRDAEFLASDPDGQRDKRGLKPHASVHDFPSGATVATSSTRRQAQIAALRPDFKLVPIRGNVGTRLKKLADQAELDGLILAVAGLQRLQIQLLDNGALQGPDVPNGLSAIYLSTEAMLPCVGQGALGIETRVNDDRLKAICERLNDLITQHCVTAERAFLQSMGGGCLSPVAAYADIVDGQLRLRAVSFRDGQFRSGELRGAPPEAAILGAGLAAQLTVA
ncbi:MAG: hydroxymethylbilane synthase [Pedosphaera sp.]|nr:hydroxymethylbilane synthase [Pedosphaera sp.]